MQIYANKPALEHATPQPITAEESRQASIYLSATTSASGINGLEYYQHAQLKCMGNGHYRGGVGGWGTRGRIEMRPDGIPRRKANQKIFLNPPWSTPSTRMEFLWCCVGRGDRVLRKLNRKIFEQRLNLSGS
jgi:hypothetical protein